MGTEPKFISSTCRKRLHIQGYNNFSDKELNDFKYGIRFAYAGCITLVAFGLYFQSIAVLAVAAAIAFIGAFPPYHPFDYLYNYGLRHLLKKPTLPPRTKQGRFACSIASVWLAITIYLFYTGYLMLGNIFGIALLAVGALVTLTDICIPSMIYNVIFTKKENPTTRKK
jgi:hypothetical protein